MTLRKLGAVKVKGKDAPVVAYALESLGRDEQSRIEDRAPAGIAEMTEKG